MTEQYKLQYWDRENQFLSINWAGKGHAFGDCRVRAIMDNTDVNAHNKTHFQKQNYSKPMTIEEAREYIAKNTGMLGEVRDCVGLTLEDVCKVVEFSKPIEIRNIGGKR